MKTIWMVSLRIMWSYNIQGLTSNARIFCLIQTELILVEFFQNSCWETSPAINNSRMVIFKVLLIGGSTGTMLEALQVVGDSNRYHQLYEVSSFAVCNNKDKAVLFFCKRYTHVATLQSLGLCTSPLVVGSSAEGLYKDALVICREIYKHFRGCNHHGVDLFWCLQVDHMAYFIFVHSTTWGLLMVCVL